MNSKIKSILETVLCKDLVFEISSYFWKEYPWNPQDFINLLNIYQGINKCDKYQDLEKFMKDYPHNIQCIYYANTEIEQVEENHYNPNDDFCDIQYCLMGQLKSGEYFLCYALGCLPTTYIYSLQNIQVVYFNSMQSFKNDKLSTAMSLKIQKYEKYKYNIYKDWITEIKTYLEKNNNGS